MSNNLSKIKELKINANEIIGLGISNFLNDNAQILRHKRNNKGYICTVNI
jgi:hypothetical protein